MMCFRYSIYVYKQNAAYGMRMSDWSSDVCSSDLLGGNKVAIGTVELSFPLGLPEEYQIRGRFFSDFGTLYDTDADVPGIADESSLRASVGAGIKSSEVRRVGQE